MTPADDSNRRAPGLADSALRLVTREVSRVPLLAISVGLEAWERTRPIREQALRHGSVALELAAHTPLGRFIPQPVIDDDTAREAGEIAAHARQTRLTPVAAPPERAAAAATTRSPSSSPAPQGSNAAREVGAPGAVAQKVEKIAEQLSVDEPETRDELPIADFDNVSLGSLRARLRSLSLEQLVVLREWEQAHAHRLPVITLLDNRIAKVSAEQPAGDTAYPDESAGASEDART